MRTQHILSAALAIALLGPSNAIAQVSAYSFSSSIGTWQPLNGSGSMLGMPGMPPAFNFYDDNSFVTEGSSILLGESSTGNGWPIGFTFTFNGHAYDRVGLSTEGWLAFGNSVNGTAAVNVPIGAAAYVPLSSSLPIGTDPQKRDRIAGFAMDLAAQGAGGLWPIQLTTAGSAPNRIFVAEWNVVRSGGSNPLSFQIQLYEGGGIPAQQVVKVVFGTMAQSMAMLGQVGLGGDSPADFNNRSVATSPYNWAQSQAGGSNTATCRIPSSATNLPQGLTFTWTPPGCTVTGMAVTGLAISAGNISGTLSWSPLAGASSYDYIITAGGPGDPALFSGNGLTDTSVALSGLPAGMLHAYVRADCSSGAQDWGAGLPFATDNLVEVVCGQAPMEFLYCYDNLEDRSWHYGSSSGAPLRMIFNAGTIQNTDLLTIYDGPTVQSPLLFSSATGNIAGQVINASGPNLTMRLITDDNGSCATQSFFLPMEWEVGCVDCDPVLANFTVVPDCASGQFSVAVQVFTMGSAAAVIIGNNATGTTVTASAPGAYSIGPFPVDTPVVVTASNPDNVYCSAVSLPLVNTPCPTVGCGPDIHTHCYTNNDHGQWAYQAPGAERIGIRFMAGTLATGDAISIYDGLDPMMSIPLFTGNNGGNLNGLMRVTSAANPDHGLLLEVAADNYASCATGQASPWKYVVACYDGCMPPAATFNTVPDCAMGNFRIAVDVASLGSATSLNIVNDGGAPLVTATAPGTYLVGPFPVGQHVVAEVQGANVLCSVNSDSLTENCQVGISENNLNQMHVFPNPGDGTFRLVIPKGFGGHCLLDVLDVTGRSVARQVLRGESGLGVDCNLGYLPAGRYALVLDNGKDRAFAPISILK
mgnify:CR=1 FL=1